MQAQLFSVSWSFTCSYSPSHWGICPELTSCLFWSCTSENSTNSSRVFGSGNKEYDTVRTHRGRIKEIAKCHKGHSAKVIFDRPLDRQMTSSKLKHINTDYSKLNFELQLQTALKQHNEANIRYTVKSMHEDHTSDVNILSSYSKLLHVLLWSALFRSSFLEIRRQTTMELYIWFLLHIFKYFRGYRVTQDGTTKITKNKRQISDTSMDCRVLWLKDPFNTIPSQIRGVSSIINCIWNFFKTEGINGN